MSYFYAYIDSDCIVQAVVEMPSPIQAAGYIQIASKDETLIGKKYNATSGTFETVNNGLDYDEVKAQLITDNVFASAGHNHDDVYLKKADYVAPTNTTIDASNGSLTLEVIKDTEAQAEFYSPNGSAPAMTYGKFGKVVMFSVDTWFSNTSASTASGYTMKVKLPASLGTIAFGAVTVSSGYEFDAKVQGDVIVVNRQKTVTGRNMLKFSGVLLLA